LTDSEKKNQRPSEAYWLISKGTHILAKWLETTSFHQNVIRAGLRAVNTDCEEEIE
jgi:hypothetical protein